MEPDEHLREHLRQARIYTVADANALVPVLHSAAEEMHRLGGEMDSLREQIEDLETVWGKRVDDPECKDRDEYLRYKGEFERRREVFERQARRIAELGAEVKDPGMGLIDFYAKRAGGEVVYLCWKLGEERIRFWHPLRGGFAARRPIDEL